jgi:GAF domain-containing protein
LANRNVRSITVVPISWRRVAIGAIFLRSFREGTTFSDEDIEFTKVVGLLTAKALRVAYRYEKLARQRAEQTDAERRAGLERVAFVGFLRRLVDALARRHGDHEDMLAAASSDELDRLVDIAMAVLAEEGKGR